MQEQYDSLLKSFDKALKKKEQKQFSKADVKEIYAAASNLFDGSITLTTNQIEQIQSKWVALADGKLDKSNAIKKLHGTSRAEAIQSVLLSAL